MEQLKNVSNQFMIKTRDNMRTINNKLKELTRLSFSTHNEKVIETKNMTRQSKAKA